MQKKGECAERKKEHYIIFNRQVQSRVLKLPQDEEQVIRKYGLTDQQHVIFNVMHQNRITQREAVSHWFSPNSLIRVLLLLEFTIQKYFI